MTSTTKNDLNDQKQPQWPKTTSTTKNHLNDSTHISRWLCQINPVQNIVRMMGWFFLFMTLQKVQMLCYYECRGWLLLLNIQPEAAKIHFWGPCRCSRWLLWPLCCRLLAPLISSRGSFWNLRCYMHLWSCFYHWVLITNHHLHHHLLNRLKCNVNT